MVNQYLEDLAIETGLHMWTVDDYHRMIASEILTTSRVELLGGQIINYFPKHYSLSSSLPLCTSCLCGHFIHILF
jgi:hypothetical protein